MHDSDSGVAVFVFLHEKQSQRFAHDHAATNYYYVRTVNFDFTFNQHTLHAKWRAGHKSAGIIEHELCDVFRMKTVDVLARVERAHDGCFVNMLGRRRLNENPMNARVAIKFFNAAE